MNVSASQCGSSCESGWTHYLDQSSYSQTRYQKLSGNFVVEDEEEDLSMVSDASSGPRHYYQDYEDENGSFCSAPETPEPAKKTNKKEKKIKEYGGKCNQQHSYLDDTASSKKNCKKEASKELLDFSQGSSATHLNGKSAFHKKIGFFKSGKTDRFQEGNWE